MVDPHILCYITLSDQAKYAVRILGRLLIKPVLNEFTHTTAFPAKPVLNYQIYGLFISKKAIVVDANQKPEPAINQEIDQLKIRRFHCYPAQPFIENQGQEFLTYLVDRMIFPTTTIYPLKWEPSNELKELLRLADESLRVQIQAICEQLTAIPASIQSMDGSLKTNPFLSFDPFEL
jgi:hypothetical protein